MANHLLKKPIFYLVVFFTLFVPVLNTATAGEEKISSDRAVQILNELDDLYRSKSSHGLMSMQVKTAHYTRTIRLEFWSKGKNKSLVRIMSPLKEKGTATLMSGKSVYTYLPKTDRTIRLTSGMMGGSWMGSHFTNDDLVKESRMSEDYDVAISFEGERVGQAVMEFTLTPKPLAAVVWGKIVATIRAEDKIPLNYIYYDEDMGIARTMNFLNVKKLGGRMVPSLLRVIPVDKPGEYTEVEYKDMQFDIPIKDSFFSISRLKKKR